MISFSFSGRTFRTSRVIGNLGTESTLANGPTFVLVGGMHGNEPTGVIAIQQVFAELESGNVPISGRVIGIVGNLAALERGQRFISDDLNRKWSQDFLKLRAAKRAGIAGAKTDSNSHEDVEQTEVFDLLEPLLDWADLNQVDKRQGDAGRSDSKSALYFADLHTTSSRSVPFIAINDQIANRQFALKFPVPTVIGIEEYLEGPLLSLLNDEGHVAMAFEAGQHDDEESLNLHKSFVYCALANAGVINSEDVQLEDHKVCLKKSGEAKRGIFEVVYRKPVGADDEFAMKPGFENFSEIARGEVLAHDQAGPIEAHRRGLIFMPLYQSTGTDGYFIVQRVPSWALTLSRFLRRVNFESVLVLLPGVTRSKTQSDTLVINKKVARFLAVEIFHLLGYRRKQDDGNHMIVSRREIER